MLPASLVLASFAAGDGGFDLVALVVLTLTARDGDLDLYTPVFKVKLGGDDREALFLGASPKKRYLAFVKQQLAPSVSLRAIRSRLVIGCDVHLVDPYFPIFDAAEGARQACLACQDALDLRALKNQSGFVRVEKFVVVPGTAVEDGRRPVSFLVALFGHKGGAIGYHRYGTL